MWYFFYLHFQPAIVSFKRNFTHWTNLKRNPSSLLIYWKLFECSKEQIWIFPNTKSFYNFVISFSISFSFLTISISSVNSYFVIFVFWFVCRGCVCSGLYHHLPACLPAISEKLFGEKKFNSLTRPKLERNLLTLWAKKC